MRYILFSILLLISFNALCCKKNKEKKKQKTYYEIAVEAIKNSPNIDSLNITLQGQPTPKLCWAATCTMIRRFYGEQVDLCDIEKKIFPNNNCCEKGNIGCRYSESCSETREASIALKGNGINYKYYSKILTWEEIVYQINILRTPIPYEYYMTENSTDTHLTLIVGYFSTKDGSSKELIVYNPQNSIPLCLGKRDEVYYTAYSNKGGSHITSYSSYANISKN